MTVAVVAALAATGLVVVVPPLASPAVASGPVAVTFEVAGARGGNNGGNGAVLQATTNLVPGTSVAIRVGGTNGFNGGGTGGTSPVGAGGSGGGASDLRIGGTGLADRVLVAAGGGGRASQAFAHHPGGGGGVGAATGTGGNGGNGAWLSFGSGGQGATASTGGGGGGNACIPSSDCGTGAAGASGQGGGGGFGMVTFPGGAGGGGGGGYFGGGGGGGACCAASGGGGGGGSSYVHPGTFPGGATSAQSGAWTTNGRVRVSLDGGTTWVATFEFTGAATTWVVPDPPRVDALSVASGPAVGGTLVTLTGAHLGDVSEVRFCGAAGSDLAVVGAGTVTVRTPARAAGACAVEVRTNASGTATLPAAFTFIGTPTLTAVAPPSGLRTGGVQVVLTGAALATATEVRVGGLAATFVVDSNQQITVNTPVLPEGPADVTVTTPGGTATLAGAFRAVETAGGTYHVVEPARIVDTRRRLGAPPGPLTAGQRLDVQVTGVGGVPVSGVAAVVVNVTVVDASLGGHLTLYPAGGSQPDISSLNFVAGRTVANAVTMPVGALGKVSMVNAFGDVHVIVDVNGWYDDGRADGGRYNAVAPRRVFDSRATSAFGRGERRDIVVTGVGGVPATGVSAVVLNVTATNQTSDGYLTVWPAGTATPEVSSLNFSAGRTIANLVTVGVDVATGKVAIANAFGSTDVLVDVVGWYDAAGAQGALFHPIVPRRIHDTRRERSPLTPNANRSIVLADHERWQATALVLNVAATNTTSAGYLTVHPGTAPIPETSSLNWNEGGSTTPNMVVAGLADHRSFDAKNAFGQTDVVVDLFGYFAP